MPSLPALPVKNSSLRDTGATNVLYDKATREYLTRNFPAALATLSVVRSQSLSLKSKRKCFSLYIAVLDSITSLGEADLKVAFGREGPGITDKLKSGSLWSEAEAYFENQMPGDIAINLILSLTRHMTEDAELQGLVENYLTTLDPDSGTYDSVSELYTLQVLPRCGEWVASREFIEMSDSSDERREAWLQALIDLKAAQEEAKERRAREAEEAKQAEAEARKLRKIRKSRNGSKKSAPSVNGSMNGSIHLPATNGRSSNLPSPREERIIESDHGKATSTVALLTDWTRSLTLRFSPRIVKLLLFLALVFGATGRREIRERIKTALKKAGSTIAAGFRVSYV